MTYTEFARAQLDALQVKDHVRILALETSCDETAAAIIEDGRTIVSNIVFSQIDLHALYGGVVPEIASRARTWRACRSAWWTRRSKKAGMTLSGCGRGGRDLRPRSGRRAAHRRFGGTKALALRSR